MMDDAIVDRFGGASGTARPEPPTAAAPAAAAAPTPSGRKVRLELADGVRANRGTDGQVLLYHRGSPHPLRLGAAVDAGWCRVVPSQA